MVLFTSAYICTVFLMGVVSQMVAAPESGGSVPAGCFACVEAQAPLE